MSHPTSPIPLQPQANQRLVSLPIARALLGPLFDESTLDQHTLALRPDGDIALAPLTWIRLVLRARELAPPGG